jgi:hypothetical protein
LLVGFHRVTSFKKYLVTPFYHNYCRTRNVRPHIISQDFIPVVTVQRVMQLPSLRAKRSNPASPIE